MLHMCADTNDLHTSASESSTILTDESFLVCGFRRCHFEASDWDTMARHRQLEHSRNDVSRRGYRCSTCGRVFSLKTNRDRHFRGHERNLFYCPDCLSSAPLKRNDNYIRHRKLRHAETDGSITPYHTSPAEKRQQTWGNDVKKRT